MIYLTKVITINKGSSSIDEQIVLYKGDKNVEVQFVLKNNPFKQKNGTVSAYATYGQLIIDREAGPIISEVSQLSNNRVIFVITGEMIDGIEELGDYDFQIRLFNEDQSSRVTLPPIKDGIRIEEPLCEEATVNTTSVNSRNAVVMPANDGIMLLAAEPEDIFDADGSYNRTNWCSGDIITDARLNKVEEALFQINNNASNSYATEEFVEDINRETRDYIESNYATTSYVDDQRRATERYAETYTDNAIGRINLNDYAKESFVTDSINSNNSYIESVILDDYVTNQELEDAIRNIEISGGVDLTGYATEQYVNDKVAAHALDVKSAGYAMQSYVDENFATTQYVIDYTSDALGKYATKSYVNEQIGDINAILDAINGEEV